MRKRDVRERIICLLLCALLAFGGCGKRAEEGPGADGPVHSPVPGMKQNCILE